MRIISLSDVLQKFVKEPIPDYFQTYFFDIAKRLEAAALHDGAAADSDSDADADADAARWKK